MKRSSFLQRRKRIRPKRATPRRSGRVRNADYMAWIREQPCCFSWLGTCDGQVQAHHAGWHPMGRKADDDTCIPCCRAHHDGIHDGGGPWKGTTAAYRQYAEECAIRNHRMTYARLNGIEAA